MTDAQVFTLAISLVIPLSMLLYSNSRISDTKEALRSEIAELRASLRGEMSELRTDLKAGFERIELLLKMHEAEHHHK